MTKTSKLHVRLETSPLASNNMSGVGYYTQLLADNLSTHPNIATDFVNFNFLNRQPEPVITNRDKIHQNKLIPLRVYAKLQSHGVAPPFDLFKKPVDLTIFTNFATWPTVNSKLTATVVHDLTYLHYPEMMEANNLPHLQRVVPYTLKNADIIITVSNAIKQEMVTNLDVDPEKILVTPIPPPEKFKKKVTVDIRRRFKLKPKHYILAVGTIEPRKDIPTLVKAYRQLPDDLRKEYALVIAGGMGWGSQESELALQSAQEAGENVYYVGYVSDKERIALYQQASLYVSTSKYEGFGMPVLEAIASGTPAVLSDIPVFREVGGSITNYATAGNSKSFAKAIAESLVDKKFKENFQKNRQAHLDTFSWNKNIDEVIMMTKRLLTS